MKFRLTAALLIFSTATLFAIPTAAETDFAAGCKSGNLEDCENLAILSLASGKSPQDFARAADLFRQACDGGRPSACHNLGALYATGKGVDHDLAKALELYNLSCESGFVGGCSSAGFLYSRADSPLKDADAAHAALSKACLGDDAEGCGGLGLLHQQGIGVPVDLERAQTHYAKACEMAASKWCFAEAVMLLQSNFDDERIVPLTQRACDANLPDACYMLGNMLIIREKPGAKVAYAKACELGHQDACKLM